MLWYALALTVGTGFVFGLAPALAVSKPDLNTVIKQDAASAGGGRRGGRLRGTLVGVQVALCMALMIATGLLLRGLYATYTIDPGFTAEDVAHLSFGTDGGPAFLDRRFLEEVAALPGVEGAAYATQTPLGESTTGFQLRLPGEGENEARFAEIDAVTPSFFSVLEMPIVRGRNFTEAESADSRREGGTCVPSSSARRRRVTSGARTIRSAARCSTRTRPSKSSAWRRMLGSAARRDRSLLHLHAAVRAGRVARRRPEDFAATTASSILALVRARDPSAPRACCRSKGISPDFRGLSGLVTTLGAGFGALALALAAVGVYGVVSYSVTRRYREIGIRMALGAARARLLGMLLRRTMRPVVIGAVAGIVAPAALSRVLSSVLFGVSPADPIGLGGAALLVLGVAMAAGALAALPATRAESDHDARATSEPALQPLLHLELVAHAARRETRSPATRPACSFSSSVLTVPVSVTVLPTGRPRRGCRASRARGPTQAIGDRGLDIRALALRDGLRFDRRSR